MKKICGVVILAIIFTILILIVSKSAMPSSGLYPFKRVYEKIILTTKRTPQEKTDYLYDLLSIRLKELQSSYTSKDDYIKLSSSLRYSATAGNLVDIIVTYKLDSEKAKTKKLFQTHKGMITELRDSYVKPERKFLDDDLHYIELYNDMLK